jgi:hypothetical protein
MSNLSPSEEAKSGYKKIINCADKVKELGFDYMWIDTCCIDKVAAQNYRNPLIPCTISTKIPRSVWLAWLMCTATQALTKEPLGRPLLRPFPKMRSRRPNI